jgi:uncharacterized membrane protein YeaQ/YmgE (transglycosylase-associated protein family)
MTEEYYCADCNNSLSKNDKSCPKCGSTERKICVELQDKITLSDSITEIKKVSGFWLGISVGVIGSIIGGLWAGLLIRWIDSKYPINMEHLFPAIILSVILVYFLYSLYCKIVVKIKP